MTREYSICVHTYYIELRLYVFRHIMCYDLVGGRGRLVKVFCGRGAVNKSIHNVRLSGFQNSFWNCQIPSGSQPFITICVPTPKSPISDPSIVKKIKKASFHKNRRYSKKYVNGDNAWNVNVPKIWNLYKYFTAPRFFSSGSSSSFYFSSGEICMFSPTND